MISFAYIRSYFSNFKVILAVTIVLGISMVGNCQSPKKLLENGFHEQAFVNAVYKQNKKVKLKQKFTDVIYESYDKIYSTHGAVISSDETTWQQSFNALIRMSKYRAKVTHPGVYENLENMLYDKTILDQLGSKFNNSNLKDLNVAKNYESEQKYEKALELYKLIAKRHEDVKPVTTLTDRLLIIDYESKIEITNRRIGDQYIVEATEMLKTASEKTAKAAIKLIEIARTYRPLDLGEEGLLELAHLFMSNSLMQDAEKLLNTPTKKNARLAFELIERVRKMRTLSPEEERRSETAEDWGMTRILVTIKGADPINTEESLSGFLNQAKTSRWLAYYYSKDDSETFDFEMEITENQPTAVLGKRKKEVTQNTKTVEFFEDEIDDQGNTTQVKKTRPVIAVVAILSRTKTAALSWSVILKDFSDGKSTFSETKETKQEITNEFASLVSGDILALPENIESDIDLDSQPFPSDKDMLNQVKQQYLHELNKLVNSRKIHLENINSEIRQ